MKYIIFLSFLFVFWGAIVSCDNESDLHKDNTPPKISDVRIGGIDTIMDNSGNMLLINTDPNPEIDTLLFNSRFTLSARFTDNYALSSFKIMLSYDSISQPDDSISKPLYLLQGWPIYGVNNKDFVTDTLIVNRRILPIADSIAGHSGKNHPIREGKYIVKINLMDMAGLKDSVYVPVRLLYRNTILNNR